MSLWITVLVAGVLAYLLKLAGFVVPHHWLDGVRISRVTRLLPVALLSALVVMQAFTADEGAPVLDARAAAVGVAIIALLLRAPFLLVVGLAALTAALLRAQGWG